MLTNNISCPAPHILNLNGHHRSLIVVSHDTPVFPIRIKIIYAI